MLITCFGSIVKGAVLSLAFCLVGAIVTAYLQGSATAWSFVKAFVVDFNGVLVGATSYGLLFFVNSCGRRVLDELHKILTIPDSPAAEISRLHEKAVSPFWRNVISVPLTVLGVVVFWNCGFPFSGFPQYYLAFCVNSIWWAASMTLAFLIFSLLMFNAVDIYSKVPDANRIASKPSSAFEREEMDDFFIILPALGLVAIYTGFLAAVNGFPKANVPGSPLQKLLPLPILFYLPANLLASFHPRYVLRRVFERDLTLKFDELERQVENNASAALDLKEKLGLSKLLYEVKEKMLIEGNRSPLLGVKDAPTLTVAVLIIVEYVKKIDLVKLGT